jgi:transposase
MSQYKPTVNIDWNKLSREDLITMIQGQQKQIEDLNHNCDLLVEQINCMMQNRFGRKTESTSNIHQLSIFNEAEEIADPSVKEIDDIEQIIPTYTRKVKAKGKREEDLSTITDTVIENHEIPEERLKEIFKDGYKKLPDEVYRRLELVPARFRVVEHHIAVYAGKDNTTIIKADRPTDLFRNSIATPSLVAGVMHAKYVNAQPLYRQEQTFLENDIHISRQTMANWMIGCGENYLNLVTDKFKEEMIQQHVIHADETPVQVRKDDRPASSKSYMWVYKSSDRDKVHKAVIYEYQKTRNADHPKEFLKGFKGVLVTDGYQAYHKLAKESDDLKVAGCWVHARRPFANIVKAMGKKSKGSLAEKAAKKISNIYHIDNQLIDLSSEERLKKRKKEVEPLVDDFFKWVKENQDSVPSGSQTGKGFTYCLNQETYLRTFLDDPSIPLDNSAAERAIRPFTIGRKNWVMIDSIKGASASAVLYSIVETAKANDLKLYEYLKYLLEEIPKHMEDHDLTFLDNLMPWSENLPKEIRK